MNKIIFVCYDQGAGGEKLSHEISKIECVNNLECKQIGDRYITKDITHGISRHNTFKQDLLQHKIAEQTSDKWFVVPTHFSYDQLESLDCKKFYVTIYPQSEESKLQIERNKKEKVWKHIFYDPLEVKGQIEADNGDPYDKSILSNIKGPVQYGKLWSLVYGIGKLSDDLEKEYEIYCRKGTYHSPNNLENSLNIEYSNLKSTSTMQQFTKNLQDHLTKYS